jgi:hypothetical protein
LQRDDSDEAKEAEEREKQGGPCEFDRTEKGLRLHPINFISRRTTAKEKFDSGYMGEAGTAPGLLKSFDNSSSAQSLPCSETRCP